MTPDERFRSAVELLQHLIATPSFSREEHHTAAIIEEWFALQQIPCFRQGNNVWAHTTGDASMPCLLLNSHHDTVRPNSGYTRNPFSADIEDGKLYGLGSNDAGGALVGLLTTFAAYYRRRLPFRLVMAATAEEEIAGTGGIASLLPELGRIDGAIVGEPTTAQMAVAEKGLMVLDCEARGVGGHAARSLGVNAIYEAMRDIEWFRTFAFPKISPTLGPVKMTVTQISAGSQHNVIPDSCRFVVDVRLTDAYSHEEVLEYIQSNIQSTATPRSMRLRPSSISPSHPIVKAAVTLGIERFGSPTMSDQALIPAPSVKIGPGMSERSHTSDEYIELEELRTGIHTYDMLMCCLIDEYSSPSPDIQ